MQEPRIIKSKKNSKFTTVFNIVLNNENLSLAAKGLYCYLTSLPDDWVIYKNEIIKHHKNGRSSFGSAWDELEENGYLVGADMVRKDGQFAGREFVFYDLTEADKQTSTVAQNEQRPLHDLDTPLHESSNGTVARNVQLLKTKNTTKDLNTKDRAWAFACIDEIYREELTMTHKGKDIEQAINQAWAHLVADKRELEVTDESAFKRKVNYQLGKMRVDSSYTQSGKKFISPV